MTIIWKIKIELLERAESAQLKDSNGVLAVARTLNISVLFLLPVWSLAHHCFMKSFYKKKLPRLRIKVKGQEQQLS